MNINFLNQEKASSQPDSGATARRGLILLLVGFGSFMLWAAFVPLSEGVIAFGSVVVDGNRKSVQHLEGGIVQKLNVLEGDLVQAGDILIELDQTQVKAQHELLLTRFYNLTATLARLSAETKNAPTMDMPEALLREKENPRVRDFITTQESLFDSRKAQMEGEIGLLNNKISLLEGQTRGIEAELSAKEKEAGFILDELTRIETLYAQDLIGLPRLLAQKKDLARVEGQIGSAKASIAAASVQINEARLNILQIEKNHQEEVVEQTLESQEKLFEVQEQLVATNDVLERTYIRAPNDGRVLGLTVWTEGGVVPAGQPLMEIVPQESVLIIEARIRNVDVDNITRGMTVRTRFMGLNQRSTPELAGVIKDVSADAMTDEKTGETYFLARVGIDASELGRITEDEIVPGMPAEVLIEAGKHTALEYLFDPLTDVFRRALTED